jgi:hypothetical protein
MTDPDAPRRLAASVALGVGLFALYNANGRAIGAGDTVPATYLAVALARGDGPFLDRFAPLLRDPDGRLPGYAEDARGRAVSRYPIGPAILAAPIVAVQVAVLDRLEPGWERGGRARLHVPRMGKHAASGLAALAVVLLWRWLGRHVRPRAALAATLAAGLGSGLWPVASQALWQHGPAALCLTSAALLLERPGRARLAASGGLLALMVACRPVDVVFAGAAAAWVATHQARPGRLAFFLPAGLGAAALAAYHLYYFDTLTGGYAAIERMHPWAHGTRGTFTGSILGGGVGTLLSPSHGLLVYSPWVALALAGPARPEVRARLRRWSLLAWLAAGLAPSFALLATYSCWWGGHCFGPRFWIDATPILAALLAVALDAPARRPRLRAGAFALALGASVALQAVGFLCYPTSWHRSPTNADRDHARLWDWRDNEVTRGLAEGVRGREW